MANRNELNLLDLLRLIRTNLKMIIKVGLICSLLGVIFALLQKNEFSSTIKVIPESSGPSGLNLGGLGGLAGIAGINLNNGQLGSETFGPAVYSQIINSTPFLLELLKSNIRFRGDSSIVTQTYFTDHYSPPIHKRVVRGLMKLKGMVSIESDFNSNDSLTSQIGVLTRDEWIVIQEVSERISLFVDETTGVVSITCNMRDPIAAASLLNNTFSILSKYIVDSKITKQKIKLQYVESSYDAAKAKYDQDLINVAEFADENKNIRDESIKLELTKLQNELQLSSTLFNQVAAQFEQSKIELLDNTPVFTVIQNPLVPYKKSWPKRTLLVISSFFIGIFSTIVVIVVKNLA